ncbi:MAG: hypothetical protein M1834_005932 [Cirrosporium novae-zelandiae]|nr:MAG: hypothetical protein M1834_005932 [Cirrosporium novae-zelandiae]
MTIKQSHELTCRVRVQTPDGLDSTSLDDYPGISQDIRQKWINSIFFEHLPATKATGDHQPRAFDSILCIDGIVKTPAPEKVEPKINDLGYHVYPPHYRIPPDSISEFSPEEQVKRKEHFAIGSLCYEIATGRKPFADLSGEEVQHRFRAGTFPDDVSNQGLVMASIILSGWSVEFMNEWPKNCGWKATPGNVFAAMGHFARQEPLKAALSVGGLLVGVGAAITLPILGAVGFSAIGPVAGSVAAGWQSSIGAVSAGSLFAVCQSAAMGGAVASTIAGVGAAGAGVGIGAAGMGMAGNFVERMERMMKVFRQCYRKVDGSGVTVAA